MLASWGLRGVRLAAVLLLVACADAAAERSESPFLSLTPTPVDGHSRRVVLVNGDTMVIPTHYELIRYQGIDSLPGLLEDPVGNEVGGYDMGASAGVQVGPVFLEDGTALFTEGELGTRDESANQVFYYQPVSSDLGEPAGWVATFAKRGPANFWCDTVLSREEFLGWMRTYTALDDGILSL